MRITLHVPATDRSWDPPSDLVLAGPIDRVFRLDPRVTAPCPKKLAELANADLATVLGSFSVEEKKLASDHLSYISDAVAVPYMERAVTTDGVGNYDLINGLARIDDARAKDALGRLAESPDSSIAGYARKKASLAVH